MIMKRLAVEKSPIWPMLAVNTYFVTLISGAVSMFRKIYIDTGHETQSTNAKQEEDEQS